jgi:hypothetical protein
MSLHNHIYGNFKKPVRDRLKEKRLAPKKKREKRPGNSEKHLQAIRTLPCAIPGCTIVGCDPHHLKSGPAAAERSVGRRASDRWTVPLCRRHHDEIERVGSRRETQWFAGHGIEAVCLAAALWSTSPDKGTMVRIILAHKVLPK